MEAISPDNLISYIIKSNAKELVETVARHRANLSRPPKTVDEYLATLEKQKLTKTVAFLREHNGEL